MARMSAEERRESVIRAAMKEFAHGGYAGTSTEAIARRVGVSQPYLFRLFPGKQAIFQAAVIRCVDDTREALCGAVDRAPEGTDPVEAMCAGYDRLLGDPERLLMQMQAYVAVAGAEATGDHEFGAVLRTAWSRLWDEVHERLGFDAEQTTTFMAHGMLINTLVAMGFPAGHRVWTGFVFEPGSTAGEPGEPTGWCPVVWARKLSSDASEEAGEDPSGDTGPGEDPSGDGAGDGSAAAAD
jgi:AcrR family transcriptional regulator